MDTKIEPVDVVSRTAPTVPVPRAVPPTPAARAWSALRYIERHPEQWHQESWNYCLAGWVVRQSGGVSTGPLYEPDEVRTAFRSLTGLGWWRTANITAAPNSLKRLRRLTRRYFGPDLFGR